MDSDISDIELIKRISNRDSKALESLYDRYSPVMYTLVKRIVSDKNEAEEIIADIFVIIWQKSSMFDLNSENLYSWLINLARNKALDHRDRKNNLIDTEYSDEYEDAFIIPKLSAIIPPNDLNQTINRRERIYSAVHSLTDAQKYVLSLAYYDGMSESAIAKKLNIPLLTVKSKIRVALNSLHDNLTKEEFQ